MKIVGLITEYNPFHNGHKYHIEEAKRVTGADYVIAVMSGNFVQRGTPAVIDKYIRTEMALNNGIDLVLELPVCYATGSAEFFAHGAVSLLDKLGIVDALCFGSEYGDIGLLKETAKYLLNAPASFEENLQAYLKEGLTFPAARVKALEQASSEYQSELSSSISKVLMEPNNILGIEYMKAILNLNSTIESYTIQRIAAQYHDSQLNLSSNHIKDSSVDIDLNITNADKYNNTDKITISSATAIRRAIDSKTTSYSDFSDYFEDIKHSVPHDVFELLSRNYHKTYPITEEDFSRIMKYKLLSEDSYSLAKILDISNDLADRLKNLSDYNLSVQNLIQAIKTKNMTLTRINRAFIHLLLNIKTATVEEYNLNGYTQYARVLGVKKEASHLLRNVEAAGRIPIITKVSKASDQLDSLGMRMLHEDIFATHLYNQIIYDKFGANLRNEYKHGIILK